MRYDLSPLFRSTVGFDRMASMLDSFDSRFCAVHQRSRELIQRIETRDLFRKPRELDHSMAMFSAGVASSRR